MGFSTEVVIVPFSAIHNPGTVIKMFPRAFTKVKEGRTINLTVAGKMKNIIIPNLIKTSLRNANLEISRLGLGVDTIIYEYDNQVKDGNITFQLPRSGKEVTSSTNMTLGVSRGSPPDYYLVPDVVNLSLTRAQNKIIKSGLRVGNINFEFQPDLLNNTVIEQYMTAGMRVSFPAAINLLVSIDSKSDK
jgi:serine/threonine-protein kinase